jgi:hypothetical protein
VSGQLHAPTSLPPEKESPVPIGYEVGRAPEQVRTTWRRENSWPYQDSNSDTSHCTDCVIVDLLAVQLVIVSFLPVALRKEVLQSWQILGAVFWRRHRLQCVLCVYPWEPGGDLPECDFMNSLTVQMHGLSLGCQTMSCTGRDLIVLLSAYLLAWSTAYWLCCAATLNGTVAYSHTGKNAYPVSRCALQKDWIS